jgi:hypothetical protein
MTWRPSDVNGNSLIAETWRAGRDVGRLEGREAERARKVVELLRLRGVPGVDDVCYRVTGCSDLGLLDVWFERALTASHAGEIFDH